MTVLHGYCVNAEGSRGYHRLCPHTWAGVFGATHTCNCPCHNETESA